ncbi:MAG: metal-dependent transcriptional regulator [Planctomycetota bacterium]
MPRRHRHGRRSCMVDEGLETLWMNEEKGKETTLEDFVVEEDPAGAGAEATAEELVQRGLAQKEGKRIEMTSTGREAARAIIRRHRLAERLLADVLDVTDQALEKSACEFEHLLAPEVERSICTLLGHPRFCPHHCPIPDGACCRGAEKELGPVIRPLRDLGAGAEGRIAYIAADRHTLLDQLASVGILPGVRIHVHQTNPAFVVEVGETSIALDETFAKDIFVRCG